MKVIICRPVRGSIPREHQASLEALRAKRTPGWEELYLTDCPNIDIARAALAEEALALGAEVVLMLDADMVFTPEDCFTLVETARERRAVVGAVYLHKKDEGRIIFTPITGTTELVLYQGGGVVEVVSLGLGLTAIHRDVFEGIKLPMLEVTFPEKPSKHMRPWFTADTSGRVPELLPDDATFCRRAREAGFQVFVDTRLRVGHVGTKVYYPEDMRAYPVPKTLLVRLTEGTK